MSLSNVNQVELLQGFDLNWGFCGWQICVLVFLFCQSVILQKENFYGKLCVSVISGLVEE